ncbi:MAG: 30S ribosomal protein S1 [Gammaproteobacteria bacterium]|nr:30S ribosomal protein S1 [Gammaproteobacteria bacterium]
MIESFAQLLEESEDNINTQPGMIINGTVVDIGKDAVVVNAGLKSEGMIPIEQFQTDNGELEVAVGDEVEVALDALEDGYGETKLSREKARRARAWTELERIHEAGESVTGVITGKVKGGFTVELRDLRAFLPSSLVDIRPVRDTTYLEGRELEFKLVKIDTKRNNIVVSRRAVVESEYSVEREELINALKEGAVVKGIVKNLTDYGAFLDLGGIDGLLHITDMSWKRVKHPSEIVSIGDEIEVRVLKFDKEKTRVSLGLKQLNDDPWSGIDRRYPESTRVFGKVTNIADYGCFVEIEEGIEGLVHVSEMDWTNKNVSPAKVASLGDEVEVMVLDIDEERRRISLGMKQCQPNPWDDFASNHGRGSETTGIIKSITDFGIFVGLEGGIDGLVHLSDLAWNMPGEEAVRAYKKGDELRAMVLSVDAERERISLGVKQLVQNPFSAWIAENPKGSIVTGTVSTVDAKAATVQLAEGVEGMLKASEIARDRVEDVRTVLKDGQQVEAKFVGVDKKSRTITLSIKAKESQEEAAAVQGYSSGESAATNLGDILKESIEENKDSVKG